MAPAFTLVPKAQQGGHYKWSQLVNAEAYLKLAITLAALKEAPQMGKAHWAVGSAMGSAPGDILSYTNLSGHTAEKQLQNTTHSEEQLNQHKVTTTVYFYTTNRKGVKLCCGQSQVMHSTPHLYV